MKALLLEGPKKPWQIKTVAEPLLKHGMVMVRLKAAAFNHRDLWISKGQYAGIKYPIIPGSDGSGVIVEVGGDLSRDLLGTEVIINPSQNWGGDESHQGKDYKILGLPDNGTFAELIAVPFEFIHKKPMHLSFEQAAALPLAGLTAFRALFSRARVKEGDKVFVSGIGGGVALCALMFAKAAGCEVWVSSSSQEKIRSAIGLGASGGGNYKEENWQRTLKEKTGPFDVIIDGAGGEGFSALVDLAAPGGRIAIYGGTAGNIGKVSPQKIFWKQLSILGSTMGSPNDFHNMIRFVREKELVPVIDEVFPFSEATAAAEKMEAGKQFGKLVVSMD